jgi:very-short-patch-repair endonuclease
MSREPTPFDGMLFDDFCTERTREFQDLIRGGHDDIFLGILHESRNFLRLFDKCESPIERLLLLEFCYTFALDTYSPTDPDMKEWSDCFHTMGSPRNLGKNDRVNDNMWSTLYVKPQHIVVCGNEEYRIDFQLKYDSYVGESDNYNTRYFAIEVDGHDFHEKTKEQVQRDKKRDRALVKAGYKVLRFAGSEIFKSPTGVVKEIIEVIEALG